MAELVTVIRNTKRVIQHIKPASIKRQLLMGANLYRVHSRKFLNFRSEMSFFYHAANKAKYVEIIQNLRRQDLIIDQADLICNHVFNLLGSGRKKLGEKINWQQDFISGFTWPKQYYYQIKTVDLSNNADVKVPWELSRFQHLPTLGQAYWITGQLKYSTEFFDQVQDWMNNNPVGIGVNWACTMDVAIRAVNWIFASYYFLDCQEIPKSFWVEFYRHLFMTGRFIINNFECYLQEHGNNHLLSDFAGLVWLGLFFRNGDPEARKWLETGIDGLIREMRFQVNSEGTDFEDSIHYHRLVLEIFLSTTILAEMNGIHFPASYRERLENMAEFLGDYLKPNGLAPQIGDADDGRFYILSDYGREEKRDHRGLLRIAGEYFNRDDFRFFAKDNPGDALWFFEELKPPENFQPNGHLTIKEYPQTGLYIIRDDEVYLIIRCGNFGHAGGGHSHNDQLSFELNIRGNDIFVDPGSYVYTANWRERNTFRSTACHNTLQINDDEQNEIINHDLFRMVDHTQARVLHLERDEEKVIFIGEHQGYFSEYGVIHRRRFEYRFREKKLIIKDYLNKPSRANVNFILNEDIHPQKTSNRFLGLGQGISISFNSNFLLVPTFKSNSYGVKLRTWKIQVTGNTELKAEITY
jgi:hypothetical protein